MSVRAPVVLGALLLAGCGLVSGLDSLGVEGGTPLPDAAPDVSADVGADAQNDVGVVTPPDASPGGDAAPDAAARSGTALQTKGGCATASGTTTLTLSNSTFTIELWLRLDAAASNNDLEPVLWKGGRTPLEPGWSLDVQGNQLTFCVADSSAAKCTTPYQLALGHLVHLGIRSTFTSSVASSRSVNIYARDISNNELNHTAAGAVAGAANSWTSTAPFTVGGAMTNNLCTTAPAVTIDDVRVYASSQSVASMDNNESVDVSCGLFGLLADYNFNEGSGTVAKDCTASAFDLTVGQNQKFIPSPFP